MSVDINRLFQHVNQPGLGTDAKVFIRQGGAIDGQSQVGRLRAFFTHARAVENQASIDALISAIRQSPQFSAIGESALARLAELRGRGQPLTAGHIREVQDKLYAATLDKHMRAGIAYARDGRIPQGEAMQFATFCAGRGVPFAPPAEALKAYNAARLEANLADSFREVGITRDKRGMPESCARVVANHPSFKEALDSVYAENPGISFADAERTVLGRLESLAEAVNRASDYYTATSLVKEYVGHPDKMAALATMAKALDGGVIARDEIASALGSLGDAPPTEHARRLLDFRYQRDGTAVMEEKLAARGLPTAWGRFLAHRPELLASVESDLAEKGMPPEIPDSDNLRRRLNASPLMDELLDRYADKLAVAHRLVTDPPALLSGTTGQSPLNVPLTEKRVGELINGLLDSDFLLDTLSPEAPFDPAAFLTRLGDLKTNILVGLPGGPDFAAGVGDLVMIQLALRGVSPEGRATLAEQALRRWTPLINGLESISENAMRKAFTPAAQAFCSALVATSGFMRYAMGTLFDGMSDADAARLGLERATKGMDKGLLQLHVFTDARMPLDQLPPSVRDFALAHGARSLPELAAKAPDRAAEVNRAITDNINKSQADRVIGEVDAEFFRGAPVTEDGAAVAHPQAFRALLDELGGLPDGFDAGRMDTSALRHAYRQAMNLAVKQGKVVDTALARAIARDTIRDSLQVGLRQAERNPRLGAALLAYPVPGFVATDTLEKTRGVADLLDMRAGNAPTTARAFFDATLGLDGLFKHRLLPKPANLDALQEIYMSALLDSALQPGRVHDRDALLALLDGPMGRNAGRDLATLANAPAGQLNASVKERADMAVALYRTLRMELGAPEQLAPDDLAPRGHLSEVTPGLWEGINGLGLAGELGKTRPTLTPEQWNLLTGLIGRSEEQFAAGRQDFMLSVVIQNALKANAGPLADAFAAAAPREPSPQALWRAVTGQEAPRGLNAATLFPAMAQSMLKQARELGDPNLHPQALAMALTFVSFPKMLEANRGGQITLADLRADPNISSLRQYTEDNAYGLVTDFRRAGPRGRMMFNLSERMGREFVPHHIPDSDNTPGNPEFVRMIQTARELCRGNETQAIRLLQCCSQATLIIPRVMSSAFPGLPGVDEHGDFTMIARRRENGDVEVIRDSMEDAPLAIHMVYVLKPDGQVEVETFDMARR